MVDDAPSVRRLDIKPTPVQLSYPDSWELVGLTYLQARENELCVCPPSVTLAQH